MPIKKIPSPPTTENTIEKNNLKSIIWLALHLIYMDSKSGLLTQGESLCKHPDLPMLKLFER